MKKLITSASLLLLSFATFGQGLSSKKGHAILPEAKDWSISFDAVPFLDYAFDKTRIFNNTAPSSAAKALNFQTPMTIVGKYMIDENTAYRAKARFGINRTSKDTLVNKVGSTTGETVTDNIKESGFALSLSAGIQHYRGKGRLRGFYGAEGMLGISKNGSKSYEYGNPIAANNPGVRTLKDTKGMSFSIGIRGFIGAEYFFAPKMSVGAEFGYGISLTTTGQGTKEQEEWDNGVITRTTKTGGGSSFNLDVDNANSAITFSIYF